MFPVLRKTERTVGLAMTLLVAMAIVSSPSPAPGYTFDDVEITYWAGADPEEDGVNEALMVLDWQIPEEDSGLLG